MAGLLVLDLDDTLYLESSYVKSGFRAVAAFLGSNPAQSELYHHYLWQGFLNGVRTNAFNRLVDAFGIDAGIIPELIEIYRNHTPTISLAPDTDAVLSYDGARRALVTDGFAHAQRKKIAALGIAPAFEMIVVTGEYGPEWTKPSTRAFSLLQEKLEEERCVYVGDNPRKDFQGPRALGWAAVRIRRKDGVYSHLDGDPAIPEWPAFTPECLNYLRTFLEG